MSRGVDFCLCFFVVPHGLTDAWCAAPASVVGWYGAGLVVALSVSGRVWWVPAGTASVVHFAGDVGAAWAVLLVAVLAGAWRVNCERWAYALLLAYMMLVHLPRHYASVGDCTSWVGVCGLVALGVASAWLEVCARLRSSAGWRRAATWLVVSHTLLHTNVAFPP